MLSITSIVAFLASASLVAAAPALDKREFCIIYNTQDCRSFDLVKADSDGIENHMVIGNAANIDSRVPEFMHGIFYMEGNPLSDEVLSLAGGVYNEAEKAYYLRVYDAGIWSWDDSLSGHLLYDSVRTFGLTYKLTFDEHMVGFVEPIFYAPTWMGDERIPIASSFANFTIIPTADPNFFVRESSFLQKDVAKYQFVKIVHGNGTRTEKYESVYRPRIGAGKIVAPPGFSDATHLGKTQLLAKATMRGDEEERKRFKLVMVGDGTCGKTALLMVHSGLDFPEAYVPTIFENFVSQTLIGGKVVELSLWDTAGQEEYDRLRPLSYPGSDVVLIGYDMSQPPSFWNVREKWHPEVSHFLPNTPLILVGLKKDLKTDPGIIESLRKSSMRPVPTEEGERIAKEIGAKKFFECSARSGEGVSEIFQFAAKVALKSSKGNSHSCKML
ncbi:GTP-binding protein Rho1 [Irineochytrium annulatum]|nr:GTP-binding protein Rho1 [Irineochytrium annulatum]